MKALYLRTVYFLGVKSGGSVTHTAGVINALSGSIELDVYSNDTLPDVQHKVQIITPILKGIPVLNELLYNFKVLNRFRKLKSGDYDFIYQRYSGESFNGARLSQRSGIPFVLEFNSSEVWKLQNWSKTTNPLKNGLKKFIQLPITRKIETYNLKRASLIVVVSEVLRDNLIEEGISASKILVNPNGVNPERFDLPDKDPEILKKFGLEDKFVVGFIGTFGKWHGVVELAHAAVRFFEKYPEHRDEVRFLIIGSGKLFPEVETIIRNSPFADHIHLTGNVPQEESPRYLKCCDLFLSPHIPNPDGTRFFGSPTKLFEYMACGRPIIASALDQIADIFEHGESAHLVEPANIEELADAIAALRANENYRTKLAEGALELMRSTYTWERHVERILRRMEELKLIRK